MQALTAEVTGDDAETDVLQEYVFLQGVRDFTANHREHIYQVLEEAERLCRN